MLIHSLLRVWLLALCAVACGRPRDAGATGEVLAARDASLPAAIAADSTLRLADQALRAGHPWRATQLLAPVLADARRRTPAAVLLAARAAAAWGGWSEVTKLLGGERWLDTRYNGEGRELLARAALERDDDTTAVANATAAVPRAPDARTRAVRLVLLGRALDRMNQLDSARAAYTRAAAALRDAHDWLLLRAAGVDTDSTRRAQTYASVRNAVARARVPWTEAQALERSGNIAAASARYAALGARVNALRLRLSLPSDSGGRAQVRRELLSLIRAQSGSGEARSAVDLLDKYFTDLTPSEQLLVARSAAASGPLARAITGYAAARAGGVATAKDVFEYGQLLARAGRYRDAIAQFEAESGTAYAADAAYQRARALLSSGNGDAARAALRDVASRYASDTSAASSALYLLADLTTDDGRDADARDAFLQAANRYPTSARADDARFRAGIISFALGQYREAAGELDTLLARYPSSREALSSRYWSARALAASGDSAAARTRWRQLTKLDPLSYYAALAARRLGERPWAPRARADSFPHFAAIDAAMRRIALLEDLGMDTEAHFEEDALEDAADSSLARLLATAAAFRDHGLPAHAARLGARAIDRGAPKDARVYRLVYPLVDRAQLVAQAKAHHLDPALVAGLIRQESSFNPHALSAAGARGLMQVMPSVGQQVARNLDFPVWDQALLFDPDANLQLGTAHLAGSVKEYDGVLVRVLAAYNAGASRATRWAKKGGADDPELYAERIPFVETRDYVRIVQRNAELYSAMYFGDR